MATIGSKQIHSIDQALLVLSCLRVDADGSPRAYAPKGSGLTGLDYLANAGRPGNWFGVATDPGGEPYVQGPQDPRPGYLVSTTALEDGQHAVRSPLRYLDSETVPFVVIPGHPPFGVRLGDVGFGLNLRTGASSEFIVGDVGPANQIGEGSIRFAQNLGVPADAKTGGTESDHILYCFFAGSRVPWPSPNLTILDAASTRFLALGGFARLKRGLPFVDWSRF